MIRRLSIVLSLVILIGGAVGLAGAQSSVPKPAVAPLADTAQLVGTWTGQFHADHGDGDFTLTIARDSTWTATIEMTFGGQSMPTRVSDFKVEGNNLSWTQELMGGSCAGSAVLAAGTLRGQTACGSATAGYLLRKK